MLILRLENCDGVGIYHNNVANEICNDLGDCDLAYSPVRHPMPERDSLLVANGFDSWAPGNDEFVYGFKDYAQFRAWFFDDDFLGEASNYGIYLSVFHVNDGDYYIGNSQSVFRRGNATEVEAFNPDVSKEEFETGLAKRLAELESEGIITS